MAIITISHEMGAGGTEIGKAVAQHLGYRYLDQELIQDAVRRSGLPQDKLSHLDESKPTLFERFAVETRHYIAVLQTTFLEFAEGDDVVLMGRGGQWLLRGLPHVLRVRVMAPFEPRVRRWIKQTAALTGETPNPRVIADLVRRDDAERAGRMRYLYEVDLDDPTLYELILNTERVSFGGAAEVVAHAARRPEFATTEEGRRLVQSQVLASRVQVALALNPDTRRYRILVEAADGIVTLEAAAGLERAMDVARAVPGVREVRARQVDIPSIPTFVG